MLYAVYSPVPQSDSTAIDFRLINCWGNLAPRLLPETPGSTGSIGREKNWQGAPLHLKERMLFQRTSYLLTFRATNVKPLKQMTF